MRFMMIIKPPADVYDGVPDKNQMLAMSRYSEELERAGVLVELHGLASTTEGAKVKFSGAKRTVIDGPFTEAKEVIGGYWIIDVGSKEEAVAWAQRIPCGTEVHPGRDVEVEVRRIVEADELARLKGESR